MLIAGDELRGKRLPQSMMDWVAMWGAGVVNVGGGGRGQGPKEVNSKVVGIQGAERGGGLEKFLVANGIVGT